MTAAHTPGPWTPCFHLTPEGDDKCPCGYRGGIWGADGAAVVCEMGSTDCELPLPRYPREVELANARVVIAAPEMLRILKQMISQLIQGGEDGKIFWRDDCVRQAREIIAQAEGRS